MIPCIYICGPYRGPTRDAIDLNIQSARRLGALAAAKGWAPLIPHSNYAHLDYIVPAAGDDFWLAATLELMRRCDAVLLCPGWEHSQGVRAELLEANRLKIPVWRSDYELPSAATWLASGESGVRAAVRG